MFTLFVERAPHYSFFEADHAMHSREGGAWDFEGWAFGWHLVVSRTV
jgi:hypothetical protein